MVRGVQLCLIVWQLSAQSATLCPPFVVYYDRLLKKIIPRALALIKFELKYYG